MAFRSRYFTFPLMLVLVSSLALSTSGCKKKSKSSGEKKIMILTNGSSPFWDAAVVGAQEAAKDHNLSDDGYKVVVDRNDFTVDKQVAALRRYRNSGDVVAVAISVTNAQNQAIADEMKRLQDDGIKVITIDSDVDRDSNREVRFAYLGTDNVVAGRELGIAVKTLRGDTGTYVPYVGLKGASNTQERIRGFGEGVGDGYKGLPPVADEGKKELAQERVRQGINRAEEDGEMLNVLVGIWSYHTPAIIKTVDKMNNRDQFTIAAFDAEPQTISGMEKNQVDVMIVQNPFQMGYKGVTLLKAMIDDDQDEIKKILPDTSAKDGDLHNTGLKIVVPNGESKLNKDLFLKSTEFMTLEEFQKWLKQYKLSGS